jgi:hypothetical protein
MNKNKLKKYYHYLNRKIKGNKILLNINFMMKPLFKYFYFKNERKMAKGVDFSKSNHKSILFFTTQKCASTFISNIFERLTSKERMKSIRFSNYLPDVDRSVEFTNSSFLNRAFKPKGYYYGAFRKFHKIPSLDKYHIVLVLRDPRDVLTSSYFSASHNHPVDRIHILEEREKALKQTIDEYVISKTDIYKEIYLNYAKELLNNENALFLKYEDMVSDFTPWLSKLLNFCDINKNKDEIQKIINETSFEVTEDKNNFKRSVKAGDHLNKLKPETIEFLNKEFSTVLEKFGYTNLN